MPTAPRRRPITRWPLARRLVAVAGRAFGAANARRRPDRARGPNRPALPACAVAAWLLLLTALAAPAAAQPGALTLAATRSPLSLPLYVAEAAGLFAGEGLSVRIVDCPGGLRCLQSVLDGQADVATAGETPIVFHGFRTADFAVIATISASKDDLKVYARRASGVARPRDLAGKRIGMVAGTASQYFLDAFLMVHGVDPRSTQPVPLAVEALQGALARGQVDAVSIWEPFGYRLVQAMQGDVVALPSAGVHTAAFNLVVHRRLAGPRDADLERLLVAIVRAEALIRTDPGRARAILRDRLATDDDFVRWVWPGLVFRVSMDQSLLKTLESEARWAQREGHVRAGPAPNFLGYLHRGPLLKVQPTAVGISR